jgi:hypothetical protein
MSHSSPSALPRRQPCRSPRLSRRRNRPLERATISTVVRSILLVTAVWSIATASYFVYRDDVLTRVIGRQQNTYEKFVAQVDRIMSGQSLAQKQVEQQLTSLQQRQATLEQHTSQLSDLLTQSRNGWPESGTIESKPLLSLFEKPSATIAAIAHIESAKQVNQAIVDDKKARPDRKRRRAHVIRRRIPQAATVAGRQAPTTTAGQTAFVGTAGQQNY